MKHIIKNNTQNTQNLFKRWQRRGGWYADKTDNKANELKQKIKRLLLTEQGEICCYCETRITIDDCHIEHVLPKGVGQYAHLASSYENLLCSCNNNCCGIAKANKTIPISPLDENCETLFTYSDLGKIDGANQNAKETIQILNLDSERLNVARKSIIDMLIDEIDNSPSLSEFDKWITGHLAKKPFARFWTTTKWASEKYRTV
ncbi:MAG: TIGR02646 family protein [Planctomycetaceae bacterium]|jgi:uncharacterized protein (TIGR02646 family)|nr:TIGR02646 family protein [Planctomycetaceae bacterium]